MPITPEVLRLNAQFRAMLLANERRAASSMVRYYGVGWFKLQAEINKVRLAIQKMIAAGETVNIGKISRLTQMRTLQQQVERELFRFAKFADSTISAQERTVIAAAERQAYELVKASFPGDTLDAVQIDFFRLPSESVESLVGFLEDGTPLADLLNEYMGDAAQDFSETLVAGMIAGQGPRETARELRDAYGMGLTKALQISRTEILRAYRTATQQNFEANSDVLKGWRRSSAKDDRVCAACILLDGTVYKLKEDMDDHTSGRCAMIPITKTYAELGIDAPEPEFTPQSGREWFEQQDEATQKKILGTGVWQAWKDGLFKLEDIPHVTHDEVWGDSWTPKPLYELLGEDAPVGTYAEWLAKLEEDEEFERELVVS